MRFAKLHSGWQADGGRAGTDGWRGCCLGGVGEERKREREVGYGKMTSKMKDEKLNSKLKNWNR